MPYPWVTRKIRGAKKKEKARLRKQQQPRSHKSDVIINIRKRINEYPKKAAELKKHARRQMAFLSKYWGLRRRLLVGEYLPLPRRKKGGNRFKYNELWIVQRGLGKRDWPKEKKIRNCWIWQD